MVDLTLTEEQTSMREMAHDFAEKEIRPVAWEYDKDGTWPEAIIAKAWEVGLMNAHFPEAYGGAGASYLDGCLIGEELAGAVPRSPRRSAQTSWPPPPCCSAAPKRSRPSTSG